MNKFKLNTFIITRDMPCKKKKPKTIWMIFRSIHAIKVRCHFKINFYKNKLTKGLLYNIVFFKLNIFIFDELN